MNLDVFAELFHGLPQEGPGSEACTLRALDIEMTPTLRQELSDLSRAPALATDRLEERG